jgi:CBS domain-containing protein
MENITTILAGKQPHFNKISPGASLRDALVRMNSHHTDHLIVTDDEDHFLGLLTEHEIVARTFVAKPLTELTKVTEVMNTSLPVADAADTFEDCMRLMKRFNVRFLPVFEGMDFLGVISSDDLLHQAVIHRSEIFDKTEKDMSVEYSY